MASDELPTRMISLLKARVIPKLNRTKCQRTSGFCLLEVVTSVAISAVGITGVISGYILAAERAEWSALSAAANEQSIQRVEQTRAAKWEPGAASPLDELVATHFPMQVVELSLPRKGTNVSWATNRTTISTISSDPPLKMIRSETTWSYLSRGVFTNTIIACRAPDS